MSAVSFAPQSFPQHRRQLTSRSRSLFLVLTALGLCNVAGLSSVGCRFPTDQEGVDGVRGRVAFDGDNNFFFTERLIIGSESSLLLHPLFPDEDRVLLGTALVESANPAVLSVSENPEASNTYTLKIVGAGESILRVLDPNAVDDPATAVDEREIDAILVRAAETAATHLFDGNLVQSSIDARLPSTFALVEDASIELFIGGTDRCGGGLANIGAGTLTSNDPDGLEVNLLSDGSKFVARAKAVGSYTVDMSVAGTLIRQFNINVVDASDVDFLDVRVAAFEESTALLWARAFAGAQEVVGVSYAWRTTNPLISLSSNTGVAVSATLSPLDSTTTDLLIDALVFDAEGSIDLLTTTEDQIINTRVPNESIPTAASTGCGGQVCDPYAALALAGLGLLSPRQRRLWRRLRTLV